MSKENTSLNERARKAAIRYLEYQGHEILKEKFDGFIVSTDCGGCLVFTAVIAERGENLHDGDFPADYSNRAEFEHAMADYLIEYSDTPVGPIRCDSIAMRVISDDRALVRHYVDALA